ncbi:hypothetical protein [Halostella pelagica]|uniref:hypothetical protein n=1 Tax=Halostella pelagica TaxID=2583824 RepID=UPI001080273D|nr:hypothetical protein [Halostella pelagica]
MTRKYGVSVDDETGGRIEQYRIREDPETGDQDIVGRSQAVRELVNIGLAVTDVIEDDDSVSLDHGKPREGFARQAVLNELRREFED